MIQKSKMKVGLLIWWTADRHFKAWDCPAIVTKVTKKYFKVKSLDDFKETDNLRMDDDPDPRFDKSVRTTEMRVSSVSEVEEYFNKRIKSKQTTIKEAKASLAENKKALTEYEQTVESFLTDWR